MNEIFKVLLDRYMKQDYKVRKKDFVNSRLAKYYAGKK